MFPSLRRAAPAILLGLIVLVPALNKAFTIDDTLFLRQAQQLSRDPLHPMRFQLVWNKDEPEPFAEVQVNGPVMAALLVPAIRAGGDERVAHLPSVLLLLFAAVATVSLARRFGLSGGSATLAGLLVVSAPAALAMGVTAMPDVPSMAFGAIGMERLWAYRDARRPWQALLAALSLALAGLSRSHLWLLVPLGALLLIRGDPLRPSSYLSSLRRFWPLSVAVALGVGAIWLLREPSGTFVRATSGLVAFHPIGRNLCCFAVHWVVALPLTVPWMILRWKRLPWRAAWVAAPLATVQMIVSAGPAWVVPAATATVVVLCDIVREAWRTREPGELVLAGWLLLAVPIACYVHLPPKYVLASLPAAAILVARAVGRAPLRLGRRVALGAVAVGALLGALIIRADARFAGLGRRAVEEFVTPAVAQGKRVWIAGHWGFQWYGEQAGAKSMVREPRPQTGDLIVAHDLSMLESDRLPAARFLRRITDETPGGRLMSEEAGAGFYSNGWGYLPWTFSTLPVDRYDLYEVE